MDVSLVHTFSVLRSAGQKSIELNQNVIYNEWKLISCFPLNSVLIQIAEILMIGVDGR